MSEIRSAIGMEGPALVAAALLLITGGAMSQEVGHGRSIESIEEEIVRAQGVTSIDAVDPGAVSPSLLEELGDAIMAKMIDDEQQHEWMDEMMGGDRGLMGNPDMYRHGYPVENAKEILKRRYASGEIARQEYLQMLEDIE